MNTQELQRTEIEKRIDILEDDIAAIDKKILEILIQDKTTRKTILWGTKDYESLGEEYFETSHIQTRLITGANPHVIQPRAAKAKEILEKRIKARAEVFTPSWVCNEQNNLIDSAWFGRENVFNTPNGKSWETNSEKILFPEDKSWKKYVDDKRLEIACGEAPYLVSRYDTTTGDLIPVYQRIGLFDRKMRIVNENCIEDSDWLKYAGRAMKSCYGYEFQGDSVLIARENVLYSYIDYYKERFGSEPSVKHLKEIANIIAWNIWQMDGLKYVVPYSCENDVDCAAQIDVLDEKNDEFKYIGQCPGCKKNDIFGHRGIYCRIYDWTNLKKSIPFIDVMKGKES